VISVGAGENLAEDCITGHRTYTVEEIYALAHGKLRVSAKYGKAFTDRLAADKSDPLRAAGLDAGTSRHVHVNL